jgi:hypothetical protein
VEQPEGPLTWAPPELNNPTVINVEPNGRHSFNLDRNRDYIIQMPDEPVIGGMSIIGGHNIVLIGGEIVIPWQGDNPSINSRRMLRVGSTTGTIHIEGLLGRGEDISEGIQLDAPEAIVQIQNVRIEHIHARDQSRFSDNHPDLIQPWGGAGAIYVDRFTGSTDYQGFLFKCDIPTHDTCYLGEIDVRNANIVGDPTARYQLWFDAGQIPGTIQFDNMWIDVPERRWRYDGRLSKALWPDIDNRDGHNITLANPLTDNEYAYWEGMEPDVEGVINEGVPPSGDFVPAGVAGVNYQTPGYQSN